jgi:hypothetical protein
MSPKQPKMKLKTLKKLKTLNRLHEFLAGLDLRSPKQQAEL